MKKTYRSEFIEKLDNGGVLYEKDILNMLLSNAFNGRDMSQVANNLLARFPSIKCIISADLNEILLVEGVSERVALYLKTLGNIAQRTDGKGIKQISGEEDFLAQIAKHFRYRDNEYAEFYLVNARGKVIRSKAYTSESADKVEINTAEIITFITMGKAHGLYCAHNHVGGPCRPSLADDIMTKKLAAVCAACNMKFYDHAIINSDGEIFSYNKSGRLDR